MVKVVRLRGRMVMLACACSCATGAANTVAITEKASICMVRAVGRSVPRPAVYVCQHPVIPAARESDGPGPAPALDQPDARGPDTRPPRPAHTVGLSSSESKGCLSPLCSSMVRQMAKGGDMGGCD
jgi:hypothetical protein